MFFAYLSVKQDPLALCAALFGFDVLDTLLMAARQRVLTSWLATTDVVQPESE